MKTFFQLREQVLSNTDALNESHFKVGDEVECIKSGMEGVVVKVDKEEKGKYYTVRREDGKMVKYAPDELAPYDEEEDEEEDDESEMNEKTLTKAELKKRKEVADAIKRENPNMPMAKKMAIATATAKRVAEEAEQIDEISRDLARRYIRKATADNKERRSEVMKPFNSKDMAKNVSQYKKMKSREKGIETAGKKAYDIGGKAKVPARESVELDEVSDKKLDAYRQKAFADQPSGDDGSDKYRKRKFGRDLAFAKQTGRAKVLATKEEVNLDELNKSTLASYTQKAAGSLAGNAAAAGYAGGQGKKTHPDIQRFMKNRMKGIQHAAKKLAKEEVENLDEISRDLATRAAQGFANKADAAHNKKDYAGFKKGEAARKMAIAKVQGRAKVSAVARRVEETERE